MIQSATLGLLLAAAAQAVIVPALTLDDLVDQSEAVVEGRVVRSWTEWDRSRKFIWTHYEVAVAEALRGTALRTVVVSEPGGTVGDLTMQIAGAVEFAPGEEMIVFLYRTPIGYLRALGHGQGKFAVRGGRVRATGRLRDFDGLEAGEFKLRVRETMRRRAARKL